MGSGQSTGKQDNNDARKSLDIQEGKYAYGNRAQNENQTEQVTVYVTKTGDKYHTSTCQYLSKSKIAISLEEAKQSGYEPC